MGDGGSPEVQHLPHGLGVHDGHHEVGCSLLRLLQPGRHRLGRGEHPLSHGEAVAANEPGDQGAAFLASRACAGSRAGTQKQRAAAMHVVQEPVVRSVRELQGRGHSGGEEPLSQAWRAVKVRPVHLHRGLPARVAELDKNRLWLPTACSVLGLGAGQFGWHAA